MSSHKSHLEGSKKLILVDDSDNKIGSNFKDSCHLGEGLLHRAFSVFIFNKNSEVLIQKRSNKKMLWPNYWSNSCCSHPSVGEEVGEAANRRIYEELGIKTQLFFLYKFKYHASYKNIGSENEYCYVYYGIYDGDIRSNKQEIAECKYISFEELISDINTNPGIFTPWFKMEVDSIFRNYFTKIFNQ
ncbi:MAG: isopentenyl-diphosphate delta-isomerase [Gammaproteobacteria bacterium TMED78]|nr:MAG: isopentenyl-diphosphate delta-isomerase [Gammaproteobacteria bacterium TMED78]